MPAALLLPGIFEGRVLCVGTPPRGAEPAAARFDIEAPSTVGQLSGALASPRDAELFDAALISDWGQDLALPALVEVVRGVVRDEGRVAFIAPIAHGGWRGARGALIGVLRRRAPLLLEVLCNALLIGGCVDVRARTLDDVAGLQVVWGRVPARGSQDVETSTIRSTGLS